MSKEIRCKCCKEYWWDTNIHSKSWLCPNCYDYVTNIEAKLAESETKRMEDFEKGCQEYCKSNQTAIAELEKAKKVIEKYVYNIDDMNDCLYAIDQQIKSLKGEIS